MQAATNQLQLIIIRGTPGAGKSSLGRRLKKTISSGALIEIDNFRGMLNAVKWEDEQQHLAALEAAAETVKIYNAANFSPVIVIDMFMPDKLDFFLGKIGKCDYKIISLLANENTLTKRLTARKEGFKDITKGILLNQTILEHHAENEIRIDTSAVDKNEVLTVALQQLNS